VFGGLNADLDRCNDVWRSADGGRTWLAVTPSAPWAARYEHAAVVDPNGTMFVIAGISTGDEYFRDVWRSVRTCADDVHCPGQRVCRDGTSEHEAFQGLANPICVDSCDKNIYDKCGVKEACRVEKGKPHCIDPCDELSCDEGMVCEVKPRGHKRREAEPYCLACGVVAKTKYMCSTLRQCSWNVAEENCLMKCRVNQAKDKCEALKYCKWKKGKCQDK